MNYAETILILTSVVLVVFLIGHEILFHRILEQNKHIAQMADSRLDRANKMVGELSHSVAELSRSMEDAEKMVEHLEKEYTHHINQVCSNRDEIMEAYKKLLHKYEEEQGESFAILKELARRPTVSNTNNNAE